MSAKLRRIDSALLQFVCNSENTQFGRKYFHNRYKIHSDEQIERFRHDLEILLTTKLDEKRVVAAVSARRFLLRENDMEDWCELADQLTRKEMRADFWPRYRDHTAHQVLSFLLGAYLYECIPALQNTFESQYATGPAKDCDPLRTGFYYQWSTAALLHDFGYFLDVEKDGGDSNDTHRLIILRSFFENIDVYLTNYIVMVFEMGRQTPLTPGQTEALGVLRNMLGHGNVKHTYTRREDFVKLGEFVGGCKIAGTATNAWELLDKIASDRNSRFQGVFDKYFRVMATHGIPSPTGPIPIWDHGIASAILFLKLSVFCWSYFDGVRDVSSALKHFPSSITVVAQEILERIKKWDYSEAAFRGSFLESCLAMALHNLRPFAQSPELARAGYTSDDRQFLKCIADQVLPLHITDGVVPYLLMLVDQLQDWDRYPIVRTGKMDILNLIEGSDIFVAPHSGRVKFQFNQRFLSRRDFIVDELNGLVRNWNDYIHII